PIGSSGDNVDTVALGTANISAATPVNIKAWTVDPNGQSDPDNGNDTLMADFQAATFTLSANQDTLCPGGTVTLNLSPDTGLLQQTIFWESSVDGTTWTTIAGEDEPEFIDTIF